MRISNAGVPLHTNSSPYVCLPLPPPRMQTCLAATLLTCREAELEGSSCNPVQPLGLCRQALCSTGKPPGPVVHSRLQKLSDRVHGQRLTWSCRGWRSRPFLIRYSMQSLNSHHARGLALMG